MSTRDILFVLGMALIAGGTAIPVAMLVRRWFGRAPKEAPHRFDFVLQLPALPDAAVTRPAQPVVHVGAQDDDNTSSYFKKALHDKAADQLATLKELDAATHQALDAIVADFRHDIDQWYEGVLSQLGISAADLYTLIELPTGEYAVVAA